MIFDFIKDVLGNSSKSSIPIQQVDILQIENRSIEKNFDDKDIITIYNNNSANIRAAGTAQLNICGLLLTLSLGALFFIIKGDMHFHIYWIIVPSLFFVCGILASSVIFEIIAIHVKPFHDNIEKKELLNNMGKNCSMESDWARISVVLLSISIILLIIIFALFMQCYLESSPFINDSSIDKLGVQVYTIRGPYTMQEALKQNTNMTYLLSSSSYPLKAYENDFIIIKQSEKIDLNLSSWAPALETTPLRMPSHKQVPEDLLLLQPDLPSLGHEEQ